MTAGSKICYFKATPTLVLMIFEHVYWLHLICAGMGLVQEVTTELFLQRIVISSNILENSEEREGPPLRIKRKQPAPAYKKVQTDLHSVNRRKDQFVQ